MVNVRHFWTWLQAVLLLSTGEIAYAQVNLDSGLVSMFYFQGNAKDLMLSGNHGQVFGATLTSDRFNAVNSAYRFDGDDYISFGVNNLLNANFSYSIWAKLELDAKDTSETDSTYAKMKMYYPVALLYVGDQSTDDHGLTTQLPQGWTTGTYNGDNSLVNVFSNIVDTPGSWHHLVVTRNDTIVKLYRDGNLTGSTSTQGKLPQYRGSPTGRIGCRVGQYWFFKGKLDDIRLYNRAINGSEVTALFNEGLLSLGTTTHSQDPLFKLYPNPTQSGIITIEKKDRTVKIIRIELISNDGHVSLPTFSTQNSDKFDLQLMPGTYLIRIIHHLGSYTTRVVITE